MKNSHKLKLYYWETRTGSSVRLHQVLAMKALGRELPKGVEVHHHTADQLVICPDKAYHKLLHQRERALDACGNANWRKCVICKTYDDPVNMVSYGGTNKPFRHRACHAKQRNDDYHRRKEPTIASTDLAPNS